MKSFRFLRRLKLTKPKAQILSLVAANLFLKKIRCENNMEDSEVFKQIAIEKNNKELITYKVGESDLVKEGEIYSYTIKNGENDYKIALIRFENKVYATSGLCTHDLETDLSEGICFQNKLYCPKHGCCYDITNGWVECAPALDNLPVFSVEEKENKLYLYAPRVVPRKIVPRYNEDCGVRLYLMDKLYILEGAAAYACLATLRENSFSGELTLVTPDVHPPFDRKKITKRIKDTKPEDLYIRSLNWYNMTDIETYYGRKVYFINNVHNNTYVELDDTFRIAYDALTVATGSTPVHKDIKGLENARNVTYLDNIDDHQKLQKILDQSKSVGVIGINIQSLETVATIRREYPQIEVYLIDMNPQSALEAHYGSQVAQGMLDMHIENGVKLIENSGIREIQRNGNENELVFQDDFRLNTDALILFPNMKQADTEMLEQSNQAFEFDKQGKVRVDFNQRTDIKRVFAAGSCATTFFYANGNYHPGSQWTAAYHQGMTAAYNMMALNVPWHHVPINYTEQYGKSFQECSYWDKWEDIHIVGDIAKWDFIAYYGYDDYLVGVISTPSKKNAAAIVSEAIRLQVVPDFSLIKENPDILKDIERVVREKKKSGCYKFPIYQARFDAVDEFVLWTLREDWHRKTINPLANNDDIEVQFESDKK